MNRHTLQIIVIIAIFFISVRGVSQTYVYLDENGKEISANNFDEKCNSNLLFQCLVIKQTKEFVISQIRLKQKFGKISPLEANQIKKLLSKDGKEELSNEKILLISYYDSLADYRASKEMHNFLEEKFINYYKKHIDEYKRYYKKNKVTYFSKFNKEIFEKKIKKFSKKKKKCKTKFEKKFDINVVFMHSDSSKFEKNYSDFKWVKDRGVINSVFIKNDMQDSLTSKKVRFLVLKPDGEYFISNYHYNNNSKILKTLLKNKNWSDYKEDYKKSLYGNIMGVGLFKRESRYHYKAHCF
ncbi:hypothetical protein LX95_02352 [Mesonia algae]|uniref:Uncharacterized protein n=1 Tax=Mesonia algae TaxID=213248 RepID=A0A2W7JUT3_9FLAO|nr:hypothetical protein [Mesonia algae]PZW39210.1 hypothetical protein LX95_02352 [Mesonia algae]